MKAVTFVSGAMSGSLTTLGVLFKIMHWPGAGAMVVLGLTLLSLVFIPTLARYLYSK
jgi:hypothetical protein